MVHFYELQHFSKVSRKLFSPTLFRLAGEIRRDREEGKKHVRAEEGARRKEFCYNDESTAINQFKESETSCTFCSVLGRENVNGTRKGRGVSSRDFCGKYGD